MITILRLETEPYPYSLPPDYGRVDECQLSWCQSTYGPQSTFTNGSRIVDMTTERLHISRTQVVGDKVYNLLLDERKVSAYPVNQFDWSGMGELLRMLFTTSLSSEGRGGQEKAFNIGRLLLDIGDMSDAFNSLAASMSAQLRSGGNITQIKGQVWRSETYIHVYWPWLALPAVIAVSAATLLVMTAGVNEHKKGELWRSSILPLLFVGRDWGVDEMSLSQTRAKGNVTQMARVAKEKYIRYDGFLKEINRHGM